MVHCSDSQLVYKRGCLVPLSLLSRVDMQEPEHCMLNISTSYRAVWNISRCAASARCISAFTATAPSERLSPAVFTRLLCLTHAVYLDATPTNTHRLLVSRLFTTSQIVELQPRFDHHARLHKCDQSIACSLAHLLNHLKTRLHAQHQKLHCWSVTAVLASTLAKMRLCWAVVEQTQTPQKRNMTLHPFLNYILANQALPTSPN